MIVQTVLKEIVEPQIPGPDVPETGCPLEDHPDFEWHSGIAGPSHLCWDDYGRTIVLQEWTSGAGVQNVVYRPDSFIGTAVWIECDYLVDAPADSYALPIAKIVSEESLVGCRLLGGMVQIVQRDGGTWTTLAEAPGSPGHWKVLINSVSFTVNIDGTDVVSAQHQIAGEANFGVSMHQWTAPGDTPVMSNYSAKLLEETRSPCMTNYTEPYGEASASVQYSDTSYVAWMGQNCKRVNPTDAWCTPIMEDEEGAWLQWFGGPDIQPMVPIFFRIYPRIGMAADWYLSNNPNGVRFYGLRSDGSPVLLYEKIPLNDWNNSNYRTWYLDPGTEAFYGWRIEIPQTKSSAEGGSFHTCIGFVEVEGTPL